MKNMEIEEILKRQGKYYKNLTSNKTIEKHNKKITPVYIGKILAAKLKKAKHPFKNSGIYEETIEEILIRMDVKDVEAIKEIVSWEKYRYYRCDSDGIARGRQFIKLACEEYNVSYEEFCKRRNEILTRFGGVIKN